jgi:hypothetical protein
MTVMQGEFKITKDEAILHAPLSDAAAARLLETRPERVQLIGDWRDLRPLSHVARSVINLTISGDLARGRIHGVTGLEMFSTLKALHFSSQVKNGYDLRDLPLLESVDLCWQPDAATALLHPALRSLSIRSLPFPSFDGLVVGTHTKITRLWLSHSKLESLTGLDRLQYLKDLRITDAKKLASLRGLRNTELVSLDIENAPSLTDLSSLAMGAPGLELLRLVSTAGAVDLDVIHDLGALRTLHVGGRIASDVDWSRIASSRTLKRVFAPWNPDRVTEAEIRKSVAAVGRIVERFEPVEGRGRRPVLMECQ